EGDRERTRRPAPLAPPREPLRVPGTRTRVVHSRLVPEAVDSPRGRHHQILRRPPARQDANLSGAPPDGGRSVRESASALRSVTPPSRPRGRRSPARCSSPGKPAPAPKALNP